MNLRYLGCRKRIKQLFLISVISTLLLPLKLNAQEANIALKKTSDSLFKVLAKTKSDTTKCRLFSEIAQNYSLLQPSKSLPYAKNSLVIANQRNWKRGKLYGNCAMAVSYMYSGKLKESIAYAQVYLKLAKELKEIRDEIYAERGLAYAYITLDDLPNAIRYSEPVLQYFIKKNGAEEINYYTQILAYSNYKLNNHELAQKYIQQGGETLKMLGKREVHGDLLSYWAGLLASENSKDWIIYAKQAVSMYQLQPNYEKVVIVLNQIGKVYSKTNDYKNAEYYYSQSIEIANKNQLISEKLNTIRSLITLYYTNKEYKKAEQMAHDGIAIVKANKNLGSDGYFQYYLGNISSMTSKQKEALTYYQNALNGYASSNDEQTKGNILLNMANIYFYEKDFSKGYDAMFNYRSIFEKIGDPKKLAAADEQIAIRYQSNPKTLNNSISYYEKARKGYLTAGDDLKAANIASVIANIYLRQSDYSKALTYLQIALKEMKKINNKQGVASVQLNMGEIYTRLNNNEKALEYSFAALQTYKEEKNKDLQVDALNKIAMIHSGMNNYYKAVEYYKAALSINENKTAAATLNNNLSFAYHNIKEYELAMKYIKIALENNAISYDGKAAALATLASIYREAPDSILAKVGINPSDRYQKSLEKLNESRIAGSKVNSLQLDKDLWLEYSMTYEKQKEYSKAYDAYKQYIVLRDSMANESNMTAFAKKEAEFEFAKKEDSLKYGQQLIAAHLKQQTLLAEKANQELLLNKNQLILANTEKENERLKYLKSQLDLKSELNLKKVNENKLIIANNLKNLQETTLRLQKIELLSRKNQSRYFIGGIAALLLICFFIARTYYNQRNSNKVIVFEKKRSEDLLLNILPADIAEELKEKGTANARLYDEVTVMFTDFVNFTKMSEVLTPQELVDELHYCFVAFDTIINKYNIEKIKTIGDAYLAVAGLPVADPKHAENAVSAAIEIQEFIRQRRIDFPTQTFDIRIGLHSGSVVAGIVGAKKFAFDIWGDTVNTAARMEQNSAPDKINISASTYHLINSTFNCSFRGYIEAKNKGSLAMYFVNYKGNTENAA